MPRISCFSTLLPKKKPKTCFSKRLVADDPSETPQHKLENNVTSSGFQDSVAPFISEKVSSSDAKMVGNINKNSEDSDWCCTKFQTNGVDKTACDVAYEGSDELEGPLSTGGSPDIHHQMCNGMQSNSYSDIYDLDSVQLDSTRKFGLDEEIQSGHLSDPGEYVRTYFLESLWPLPKLKRSCSNLEMRVLNNMKQTRILSSNPQSFDDLQTVSQRNTCGIHGIEGRSPMSVRTSNSADKVMLKRLSSSQLLPSRSRKIWWKVFLWSQRNLHRPKPQSSNQKQTRQLLNNINLNNGEGYSSDTIDSSLPTLAKETMSAENSKLKNMFTAESSGGFPCNQWLAFSTQPSSQSWIDEWVNSIDNNIVPDSGYVERSMRHHESEEALMPSLDVSESLEIRTHPQRLSCIPSEVLHANKIIETMNPLSTVAHVSGMGLKIIPNLSPFGSLKTINLSNNFIVHIAPGSLPKGLHTLNLSRNKIVTIEGLRELTRLRVLDLGYNRIARIGHGLSNCSIIKELYLSGNKISDVEGLHRLLKLTVLDLSFNKITTINALGQLVANYSTLAALNLLGNPVQTNVGEEQLRKALCGLLPHLAYLNKQPIKPVRAREAVISSIARAALGDSGRGSRRSLRHRSQGSSSFKTGSSSRRSSSRRGRGSELSKQSGDVMNRYGNERLSRKR